MRAANDQQVVGERLQGHDEPTHIVGLGLTLGHLVIDLVHRINRNHLHALPAASLAVSDASE